MVGWLLAAAVLDASDRYLIQAFRGPAEVGIYSANYSLVSNGVLIASAPVLLAAHPLLMRTWSAGDRPGAASLLGAIIDAFLVTGMVATAGLAMFSPEVASILGPQFREGHAILPVVLAGGALWQLANYTHKPLEFAGRTRFLFAVAGGAAGLNILLNILLVPRFGYPAAAWTTLASFAAYTVVTAVTGRSVLRWRLDGRLLASITALSAGAVLGASVLRGALAAGDDAGLRLASLAAVALLLLASVAWVGRGLPSRLRPAAEQPPV
jgi:O-antigen/teichoic acid export membrane protein